MRDDALEQAAAVSALAKYGSDLAFWAELPDPNGVPEGWAAAYRENLERLLRLALNRFKGERERLQLLLRFREDCRKLISLVDCRGQAWAVMDSSRAVSVGVQSLRDVLAQLDLVAAGVGGVKTAAAAPEPAAPAALGGDQSRVNSGQLAAHANCSPRQVRDVLQDCPAEADSTGRRLWRYCDAVGPLRRWSENHRQDRLRVDWPDLAKNLQKAKAGTKKK
jgi:hypothetical protein